jgi:hypothetical protein
MQPLPLIHHTRNTELRIVLPRKKVDAFRDLIATGLVGAAV